MTFVHIEWCSDYILTFASWVCFIIHFVMRIGIALVIWGREILLTLSNCFSSSVLIFFCCVSFRSGGRDFHIRCCELTLRIKGGGQELGYSYSLNISLLTFMSAHCQDSWYHFAFNVYIYKCGLALSVMMLYLFHLWIIQTLMWNFKKNSIFVLHRDPGRRTTTRMSVCLVNTPQVSVLSTFLFLKISFYSSHPKVLISICRMLSKGLIFYDLYLL